MHFRWLSTAHQLNFYDMHALVVCVHPPQIPCKCIFRFMACVFDIPPALFLALLNSPLNDDAEFPIKLAHVFSQEKEWT
jgi:hypothetical protein